MNTEAAVVKNDKTLVGVYSASMGISLTALGIVAALEVFMLVYSVVNVSLYDVYVWRYRAFYICLLVAALAFIGLSLYAKRDITHRYKVLSVASPCYACLFFAWSLGITFSDATYWGTVDPMVFMTFSLIVPLGFFVQPALYVAIAVLADICMIDLVILTSGTFAQLTNLSIFFVFQIVLGFSFLRLRFKLAERILIEHRNAYADALTGFLNRRAYDQYAKELDGNLPAEELVYIAIDLNGLKDANDLHGHETGDKLIAGAAQCLQRSFGEKGKLYRMGGDEFVAIAHVSKEEVLDLVANYNQYVQTWSEENGLSLSTALGYSCSSDYPNGNLVKLSRVADKRMYADKARYYETSGLDRRKRAMIEELAS